MLVASERMTACLARQRCVNTVIKLSIHVINAQREMLNVLNAIRKGTIAACVWLRKPLQQPPQYKVQSKQMPQKMKVMTNFWVP